MKTQLEFCSDIQEEEFSVFDKSLTETAAVVRDNNNEIAAIANIHDGEILTLECIQDGAAGEIVGFMHEGWLATQELLGEW